MRNLATASPSAGAVDRKREVCWPGKLRAIAAFLGFSLCLAGCDDLWNVLNRSTLRSDVTALLGSAGVNSSDMQCRMVGTTRDGTCVFRLTHREIDLLTNKFALTRFEASTMSPADRLTAQVNRAKRPCFMDWSPNRNPQEVQVSGVFGRPASLRVSSTTQFEYFVLYYKPGKSDACLEVSYAYG